MSVLVDGMSARTGGGHTYLVEQLTALERVRPDWAVTVLAAPWNAQSLGEAQPFPVIEVSVRDVPSRYLFEQVVMPSRARNADLLYCPGNFGLLHRFGPPVVVTFQNPNYLGLGRYLPQNRSIARRGKIVLSRLSARYATKVVAISETLYHEVARDGFDMSKVRLIRSGGPSWSEAELNSEPPASLIGVGPFFLSLANDYPHKRLEDLVLAWRKAFRRRSSPPRLLLVGAIEPSRRGELARIAGSELVKFVLMPGPAALRGEVCWMLRNALAMVSTSELESFGLTAPEAGAVGCPVILTGIPAHREVAGASATYFEVGDVGALADILSGIQSRVAREWRWPVSWEDNAGELAGVFEECMAAFRDKS